MLDFNIMRILINIPIVLVSLTVHEFAHGWVSSKQGDPTPKMTGRLTLNPFAHIDPIGMVLMILTGFGWAKPVTVDPRYYKNKKRGMALTAIAGPLTNFIMAFVGILLSFGLKLLAIYLMLKQGTDIKFLAQAAGFFDYFAQINLCFMVFNLIPIPPLDGAKVLGMFLPDRVYYNMLQYERYAMLIIMALAITGVFGSIIGYGVSIVYNGIWNVLTGFIRLIL